MIPEKLGVVSDRFHWHQGLFAERKIVSRDTEQGRIYTDENGKEYWSMTTMLGMTEENTEWYDEWVAKIGEEEAKKESERCCERGNMIHLAGELYVRGYPLTDCYDAAGKYRRLFIQLKNALDTKLKSVYGCELPVFSEILKVGGRLDLCGFWGKDLAIIDFKGSNWLKTMSDVESYRHQLCGYSLSFEEMYGIKAKKLVNIIANERSPNPTILVLDRDEVMRDFAKRIKKFHRMIGVK